MLHFIKHKYYILIICLTSLVNNNFKIKSVLRDKALNVFFKLLILNIKYYFNLISYQKY